MYILTYSDGSYEDYNVYNLFYGDNEFIQSKYNEGNLLLKYLRERAEKFISGQENPCVLVDDVVNAYLKKLNLPRGFYDIPTLDIISIKSFDEARLKFKGFNLPQNNKDIKC